MRGLITIVALGFLALTAVAADGAQAPSVWLAQKSPVVVVGTGFKAGNAVRVTYASGALRRQRTVTAGPAGQVRAVFGGTTFARCRGAQLAAGGAELIVTPCSSPGGRPVLVGTLGGVVRGTAFLPHEHVQLLGRVSGQTPVTASVDAGAAGALHRPRSGAPAGVRRGLLPRNRLARLDRHVHRGSAGLQGPVAPRVSDLFGSRRFACRSDVAGNEVRVPASQCGCRAECRRRPRGRVQGAAAGSPIRPG